VQRRIAVLQSLRVVNSDQLLGLLRALLALGVLPDQNLTINLYGSRRPETLALVEVGRVGMAAWGTLTCVLGCSVLLAKQGGSILVSQCWMTSI
jgi:hypothetical protein